MIKIRAAHRAMRPLNDYQVFKGKCERTMQAFGGPVMAHHEAQLIVRDDQAKPQLGAPALYAIYQRSENRILQILQVPEAVPFKVAA